MSCYYYFFLIYYYYYCCVSLPYKGNVIYEPTLPIVQTGGFDSQLIACYG